METARFLLSRFAQSLFALFCIITLTFFLARLAPGGPFLDEKKIPEHLVEQMKRNYGFDKPLPVQYAMYLGRLVKGDLARPSATRASPSTKSSPRASRSPSPSASVVSPSPSPSAFHRGLRRGAAEHDRRLRADVGGDPRDLRADLRRRSAPRGDLRAEAGMVRRRPLGKQLGLDPRIGHARPLLLDLHRPPHPGA